jgi:hypothetical protein
MAVHFILSLDIPAELSFEGLVRTVAFDAGQRALLSPERATGLADAAAAGFVGIVEEAMAESRTPIRLHARASAGGLTVSLIERGLPLDDASFMRDPHWAQLCTAADAASWHCHGTGGSELRLSFEPPPQSAAQSEAPPDEPLDPRDSHEAPPTSTTAVAYTMRPFEAADAEAVVRCFYRTYGYHYTPAMFYSPQRLVAANAAGAIHSFVAQAESGEIVAHYAIRPNNAAIGEGCAAVVLPEHRGHDVVTQLRARAERGARDIGLAAYYTEPVTTHPFTQQASEHFGAKICAISLGLCKAGFAPSHMKLSVSGQRQSLTFYAKMLQAPPARVAYVPQRHRAMVADRYAALGIACELHDGVAPTGAGSLHVTMERSDGFGSIDVTAVGGSTIAVARQAVADLRGVSHASAIYVRLPLDDPGTPALCEALERDGLFFGGIEPLVLADGRDALLLQLLLTPLDTSMLSIASQDGKALLAYINAQRALASP